LDGNAGTPVPNGARPLAGNFTDSIDRLAVEKDNKEELYKKIGSGSYQAVIIVKRFHHHMFNVYVYP
jgi:hypothetical protein